MAYELPWYDNRTTFPDDPTMGRGCTAQDYTLAYALGVAENYAAEAVVSTHLEMHDPDLLTRVRFDSEHGCFFAHTDTIVDMERLAAHVATLVEQVHPDAVPGTIVDSPAFLRNWDGMLDTETDSAPADPTDI